MKHYVVDLELQTMGIEKSVTRLVSAKNEQEAGMEALLNEIHNSIGNGAEWDEDDEDEPTYERITDFDGQWVYTVYSIKEIESPEELKILSRYL
jgi:hypothetical protein